MNYGEEQVQIAKTIARIAHAGQTYGNESYAFGHLWRVVRRVKDNYATASLAWLHDVLEDTPFTPAMLEAGGIIGVTIERVQLLTRHDGEPYQEYVDRVIASNDWVAVDVKRADLEVNIKHAKGTEYERHVARWAEALVKIIQWESL